MGRDHAKGLETRRNKMYKIHDQIYTEQWLLNTRCRELTCCPHWILDVGPLEGHCPLNMDLPYPVSLLCQSEWGVPYVREVGIKFLLLEVKVVCAI